MTELERQGANAKQAARRLAVSDTQTKNAALLAVAQALEEQAETWLSANAKDLAAAEEAGMKPSLLDRLKLTPERIRGVADGVREAAALRDPIGEILGETLRPNGLRIVRKRVPLGVIGIIYEARPNVTVDAAALCLKSGNSCILRGGKEAIFSNRAAVEIMQRAILSAGLPADAVQLVQDTSRESAREMMQLSQYIDVALG